MDGYVRVSQVAGRSGERFQSPGAQRDAIEGWAKAHGVTIAAWHEDLDRSGGTMDRPGMNLALERVAAGKTSGVVVAKLDRFARTVVGGLTTIQQLHDRGARVVSVAESIDPATPVGRAMLGLLLIMAEWQRDQADEALAGAQVRATAAGRFPGKPAFGYAKTDEGLTVIDQRAARIVRRIFAERASGVGWRKIADELTSDGVRTPLGRKRWAPSTVQGIIRSEAPLGVFVGPRGLRVEEAWPAIVDPSTWRMANAVRGTRDDSRQYNDRLVAGIARCAGCRTVMTRAVNPEGFVSYGCPTRGCPVHAVIGAHLLDAHMTNVIDERLAKFALEPRPTDDGGERDRLVAARDAAARELEDWRDDVGLRAALGDHDWREGMLARARARDDAEAELGESDAKTGVMELAALPAGGVGSLSGMPWDLQRLVVERLLHSVWVRRSAKRGAAATRHVPDRVRVVWRDDADRPAFPSRSGGELGPVEWPAAATT